MDANDILVDAYERIRQGVHYILDDISKPALLFRPSPTANSIAWLIWHLTRIQDDHIADAADRPQLWETKWAATFGLPYDGNDTGYGHTAQQVGHMKARATDLAGYFDDVHAASLEYLRSLVPTDYARVVDTRFTPPVTLGVRLNSVLADDLQHVGQAAYVLGLYKEK